MAFAGDKISKFKRMDAARPAPISFKMHAF